MKIKELTIKDFENWKKVNCATTRCEECQFNFVNCTTDMTSWIHFKNKFNDKFLNQEVE
jgi:hypothetical protein